MLITFFFIIHILNIFITFEALNNTLIIMSLFQQSVVKKYIQELDKEIVKVAFDKFRNHFGNAERQANIRELKEEQYQEGFLRELFVNILGYTINPEPNFNLLTELKNEKDSKKADGAIVIPSTQQIIAVIELKGTDTTDLSKVEVQAFGYKNNQKDCKYVISSNFEKLRFYIDNAIDFEEFNLFNLTEENFKLLYLCLAKDNLLNGIPAKIKDASITKEEQITKQLYADYSAFKRVLYQNIVALNPQFDKLTLFKKTQKLLDRFLFIFFAEDRLLLPPNSIRQIITQWEQLKELDESKPLYDRFKKYFGYLNTGYKGKQYEIFAYNGGFFAPDEILDNIKIDDALLHEHTIKLSDYDFNTDVDVNILGHIFEHSLNEIEEIQSEIEGKELDKSKTKRKKDGVFYTPKYITKYIVENTVGALCTEKKKELEINDDEVVISNRKSKKKELIDKIDTYRAWLLKLTICDPACGSGAFLNQALDYLIAEHRKLDELIARVTNASLVFSDIENSVLENNIFGVDLNEEAVEIAKLSLWLKTAQKGRKLSNLSSNIKCGNSLIDDVAVAGDKAFNWQNEFPHIFKAGHTERVEKQEVIVKPDYLKLIQEHSEQAQQLAKSVLEHTDKVLEYAKEANIAKEPDADYNTDKGGFDVVIGNPPYVFTRGNSYFNDIKEFIWKNYPNNQGKINLYGVFLELSMKSLLKLKGYLGFITPETFIRTSTYQEIRKFIYENYNINRIEIFGIGVFDNVTAESIIMIIENNFINDNEILFRKVDKGNGKQFIVKQNSFKLTPQNRFVYDSTNNDDIIFEKLKTNNTPLGLIVDTRNGIATKAGKNDFISKIKISENYKKLLEAPEIYRYGYIWNGNYINYDKQVLHRPRKEETFLSEKILIQRVSSKLICAYDNEQYYTFNSINNLVLFNKDYLLKYIITLLNSKLINFYYRKQFSFDAGFTITVTKENLDIIPIKNISIELQQPFIEKADLMLSLNKELQESVQKFQRTIERKFDISDLSKKLQDWYLLSYKDFIKELGKKKIKLSLSDEAEWESYFLQESKKALEIKSKIEKTDNDIDILVYQLYGLTYDEIKIVEGK